MGEADPADGAGSDVCLLCMTPDEPTVEHIVPRTLWERFGIDPDGEDVARFRRTLCRPHNEATSALHNRTDMMDLIQAGRPVTRKTLAHLADWAVWVTLLLGLARGSGVLGEETSRRLLLDRFKPNGSSTPRGMRVYAARLTNSVDPAEPPVTPYALALRGDDRVLLDAAGNPSGFTVRQGPIHASEAIGLGKLALLVVGETWSSGPDHRERLDRAASGVGMVRIHPLAREEPLPDLPPTAISMRDVSRRFTVVPFGADWSLMPRALQALATWS